MAVRCTIPSPHPPLGKKRTREATVPLEGETCLCQLCDFLAAASEQPATVFLHELAVRVEGATRA
jgi:hypothetical protein